MITQGDTDTVQEKDMQFFHAWYPPLVTKDPLEVKIISILLYKNNNCPMLFCTIIIGNSSFLTTVKKKNVLCILIFSKKVFSL